MNKLQKLVDLATGFLVLGLLVLAVHAILYQGPPYAAAADFRPFTMGCDVGAGPSTHVLSIMQMMSSGKNDARSFSLSLPHLNPHNGR